MKITIAESDSHMSWRLQQLKVIPTRPEDYNGWKWSPHVMKITCISISDLDETESDPDKSDPGRVLDVNSLWSGPKVGMKTKKKIWNKDDCYTVSVLTQDPDT